MKKKAKGAALKARLAEALQNRIANKVKAVEFDQEEEKRKKEISDKNEKFMAKLKGSSKNVSLSISPAGSNGSDEEKVEEPAPAEPLGPVDAAHDAIFGDFEKTLAQAKSLAKVSTATKATKKTVTGSASKIMTSQPSVDKTGFFGLKLHQDNSIQQLLPSGSSAILGQADSLKKLHRSPVQMTTVNSV